MSALSVNSPFVLFSDVDGAALEDGYIYVGTASLPAEANQISTYWDAALTIPATQPIRTIGGYSMRSGSPATVYVDATDYSISVKNKNNTLVYQSLNVAERGNFAQLAGTVTVAQGGTNATTASAARTNLGLAIGTDVQAFMASASQVEMEAGTEAGLRAMSPLRVAQAVAALGSGSTQIQPISASVAANALTISASALTLAFRSTTLGSGIVTSVSGTPSNLVISAGSTLGTVSGTQSRIVVLAINNADTIELAAVNISGGVELSETGLISTTAEGGAGAADSATVVYSTTARTNVAYRVIGYIESTQATAGTWATAPSTIQGQGGQALATMSSLGYGQTWQNLTGSRAINTTYYNTTGKPITVAISAAVGAGVNILVGGITVFTTNSSVITTPYTFIVPPGQSYIWNSASGTVSVWSELR